MGAYSILRADPRRHPTVPARTARGAASGLTAFLPRNDNEREYGRRECAQGDYPGLSLFGDLVIHLAQCFAPPGTAD